MGENDLFGTLERMSARLFGRREEDKTQKVEQANQEIAQRIQLTRLADRHKSTSRRYSPDGDNQPDFFLPAVADVPLKDDISLMDFTPFRLSKRYQRKAETMKFTVKGAEVKVSSNADGMATIYDYDIVLMMISELTEQTERWKQGSSAIPERKFAPSTYDVMKFCQRSTNAREYGALKLALDRLMGTSITIVSEDDEWRRTGGFHLIDGYKILSKTKSGKISQVEIGIPNWIYDGIATRPKPTVLTYNPAYFRLDSGIARFIYRLARKAAGADEAAWNLRDLHYRSGSQGDYKKFSYLVRQHVAADDLPDYHLELKDGRNGPTLLMQRRK